MASLVQELFLTINYARIAQLVEHDLAKVGVASSSLVSRSFKGGPDGGIGRHVPIEDRDGHWLCGFPACQVTTGRKSRSGYFLEKLVHQFIARIAQLVEHDLAKVGVASPSLVSRSF
jgi:hypothetical protein